MIKLLRKKIITAILSITVIISSISIPVASAFANENDDGEYEKILTQMVTEYIPKEKEIVVDTKKETVVSDGIETSLTCKLGISESEESGVIGSVDDVSEVLEDNGYTVNVEGDVVEAVSDFSSGRLYVDSKRVKNTYGAVLEANGDHTVLQYKTPEAAAEAYDALIEDGYRVDPSYIISLEEDSTEYVIDTESIDGEYIDNGVEFHGINKMQSDSNFKQRQVTVAVLDTGVNDYFDRTIEYYNFNGSETEKDTNGHGTKVASVIVDSTSDNVSLVSMKVFDDNSKSDMAALEAALLKCEDLGVDVVNISIGIYDKNFEKKCGTLGYLDDEFKKLVSNKTAICVSAGNEGVHTDYVYPAGSSYTWTVSAIDVYKNVASFSNHGKIDFSAKGVDVVVKNVDNKKAVTSGTSFASPYITAIAANYKGHSDYTVDDLYNIISDTCVDLGDAGKDEIFGYGYPSYDYKEGEFNYCSHANKKTVISLATCENEGSKAVVCRDCGKVLSIMPTNPLGHNYKEKTKTEGTCIQKGTVTYKCSRCSSEYTEFTEISKDNHTSTEMRIVEKPTCTESGWKQEYCKDCETFIGDRVELSATGHKWIEESRMEGTCTIPGYVIWKCEYCSQMNKEETGIVADNHAKENIKRKVTTAPSCNQEGVYEEYCDKCGAIVSTGTIDALNHDYKLIKEIIPTCTEDGYEQYKCDICGDEYSIKRNKLEHDYKLVNSVNGTCSVKGYNLYTCARCNTKKKESTDYCDVHNTYIEKKNATCENNGYTRILCKDCGKVIKETAITKTGHTSKIVNGSKICAVCGKVLAVYTYTISFDTKGAGKKLNAVSGKYGDLVKLTSINRSGYKFAGWSDGKNTNTSTYKITGNCKLSAVWKKNTYTITVKNGSDCIKKKVVYGSSVVLSYKPRRGYDFTGWYIDGKRIGSKFTYKYVANKTVTAKWKKCYVTSPTIKYKSSSKIILNPVKNATIYQVYISDTKTITKKYHKLYTCNNHIIRLSGLKNKRYAIVRCGKKDSTGRYVYSKWKAYRN